MFKRHTLAPVVALVVLVLALIAPQRQAFAAGASEQSTGQGSIRGISSNYSGPKPSGTPEVVPNFVWSISLSASNYYPYVGQYFFLTAYTNRDVGPTPYNIEFYQGSRQLGYCTYGTGCRLRVQATSPGTAYVQARVAYPNGTGAVAYSNTIAIHIHY